MNWGRAKTILIILFLAIDIFLLCMLAIVDNDAGYIEKKTVDETVSVLNSHDIKISKETIPLKRTEKKIVSLENVISEPQKAAQRFLGENYEAMQSEHSEFFYKSGDTSLYITGNGVCVEVARDKDVAQSYEDVKNGLWRDLKKFGYREENIGFKDAYVKDGVCYIAAYQTFEDVKIGGTEMIIEADKSGILKLEGRCFSVTGAENTGENMVDVTSALINMIYRPEYFGMTVKDIEIMYYIDSEYIDGSAFSASPVYVVRDTKNREYILEQ